MIESIITVSLTGLLAGFIFAMPIAGPISIMITSNALKGRLRYCTLVSLGASFADFTFVFIAVYGITKLYSFYAPLVPYMFTIGAVFFIYQGFKIFRTKLDIEHLEDKSHLIEKIKEKGKGGFYTGLMINFLNPTLFIGSLTSSFFVLSLIASLGFHTGGLAIQINKNVQEINKIQGAPIVDSTALSIDHIDKISKMSIPKRNTHKKEPTSFPVHFHLAISICYAFFLALGSILWFYLLSFLLVRFRQRININIISAIVKGLGVMLCIIGLYFGYLASKIFF
jgi:threonine/homoserine/homoserine lactone efflux protein